MPRLKRELFYKPIGELTQQEFEQLFYVETDINDPNFREKIKTIADQSIAGIDISAYNINDMDFLTAYLLGMISAKKAKIPENYLMALFGEPGCGKSHLIRLISELKERKIDQITQEDRKFFGINPEDYTQDRKIRELKDMVDSITIIQKKTTRPSRDGKTNKPEIQEGMNIEDVQKCEWSYEFSGNLYGISKEEVDEALKIGHAIVIVNDPSMKVMDSMKEAYGTNFKPVIVYKDMDMEKWVEDMRKAGRTEEEINKRKKHLVLLKKFIKM